MAAAGKRRWRWRRDICVRAASVCCIAFLLGGLVRLGPDDIRREVKDGVRAVPVYEKREEGKARVARVFLHLGVKRAEAVAAVVEKAAKRFDLPAELVAAVVLTESSGDPAAKSRCGARGLMQVRWVVWGRVLRGWGIASREADLHDPHRGVVAGAFVLRHYLNRTDGNVERALALYSAGARGYAKKVRAYMARMGEV